MASEHSISSSVGASILQAPPAAPPPGQPKVVAIVDAPLSKGKSQVALCAFSYLFSEIVQKAEMATPDYAGYQEWMGSIGRHVGCRVLELLAYRDAGSRRGGTDYVSMLRFITETCWKSMFNKQADQLLDMGNGEFRIVENEPITNLFVSEKKGVNVVRPALFVGGFIEGILVSGGFNATVTTTTYKQPVPPTVFVINFSRSEQFEGKM
eukprot:TRINITY_DN2718_c0_g1_i1.p2 TRINITY_DN2718_c0_g1~~TRINITY_DN2718_c0_g1_i1.p2  ORF type:complete len:226 (-),score=66.17 TRINITY_DN2718_c0_g1_i1:1110-1736(-)